MMHHAARDGLSLAACLVTLLAVVSLPAEEPGAGETATADPARRAKLVGKVAADSADEAVHHPLRSGHLVTLDAADLLGNAARGLFCKRLGMRLGIPHGRPACPPLPGPALEPACVALYTEAPEALAALGQVIEGATCRLDVLMFTWADDCIGQGIAARLAAWAGPGRRVRVLVDGGGNLTFPTPGESAAQANRTIAWLEHQPFVEVIRAPIAFAHFDHRKLVLADGNLAWSGGRNFTERGFVRRDVVYTLAGPPAIELAGRFEHFWQVQGGQPARRLPPRPMDANAAARLVWTEPTDRALKHAVYEAVDRAVDYVWVENPYLFDAGFIARLARARRRGADVRVVLTTEPESESARRANRVTANRLLAAGVRVYFYPGPMHTKAAVTDGWAYVGTGNFDTLSLRRNHEVGVLLGPGPVVAELEERVFRADFQPEYELHEPLPLSPSDRLAEALAALAL
jgi:cardiolipin synthase